MNRPATHIASFRILSFGAVLVLFLAGCDEDVAALTGVHEPFSMYGIINPRLPTQTLLISPIEDLFRPIESSIDADVRSIDLTTGEEYVWIDSAVTNATGQLDHVFWADFRPDFGSRHRIEVVRSDGEVSTVEADVPLPVTIEQEDSGTRYLDVFIRGEEVRLVRIDVIYGVRFFAAYPGFEEPAPYSSYAFSRTGDQEEASGGWRLRINLDADYEQMRTLYYLDHRDDEDFTAFWNPVCDGLGLVDLKIGLTVGTDDWDPPGGVFDPNALAQPGTMTNVENGFGFVAGGYNEESALYPSTETLDDTWFFDFILDREPEITGCGNPLGG